MNMLRNGDWLTRERLRRVALLCLVLCAATLGFLFLTATGTLDRFGRPLGTDFSNVWSAGRMALDGEAAQVWDWATHARAQEAAHGREGVPFYGWHYPPPFLLLAALLATLPYIPALLLWQAASLAAVLAAVRRIVPDPLTSLVVLGAPVTFVCLGHGHNGFLTGALLGGGLLALERRPWLAGLLLGCLIYKPQFGLVLPVLLLAGRHWRAIAGACLSAALLTGATLLIWGPEVWTAFLESLPLTRSVVIEAGTTGWPKIWSPFAAVRMAGGDVALGWAVQGLATALAVGAVALLSAHARPALRNAAACAAALISTPYVLDYDFVVAGVGAAFLFADARAHGWRGWEKSALAYLWAVPLFGRGLAGVTLLPWGLMSAVLLLALAVRRAELRTAWPFRRSRAASAP